MRERVRRLGRLKISSEGSEGEDPFVDTDAAVGGEDDDDDDFGGELVDVVSLPMELAALRLERSCFAARDEWVPGGSEGRVEVARQRKET
jgi:hypothetical protein